MNRKVVRLYALDGVAGLVERRRRSNGVQVGVYNARQAGLDQESGACWYSVCEEHGTLVAHQTLKLAKYHAVTPEEWCEGCGDQKEGHSHGT